MNLTVRALRNLRVQLGISQEAVARSMKLCESTLSKFEREQTPMPESIHEEYERFLFDVLNDERNINHSKERVWTCAKTQVSRNGEVNFLRKELAAARILIKEYETLIGMYRKEVNQ